MDDWNRDMAQAPRDGTPILVWDGKDIVTARWEQEDGYWQLVQTARLYPSSDDVHGVVTAWMPLPEPPAHD